MQGIINFGKLGVIAVIKLKKANVVCGIMLANEINKLNMRLR